MPLELEARDKATLAGDRGPAAAFALRVITRFAIAMQAQRLIDISGAHIDGCLYHGQVGLDFARRLADTGAKVVVPTTLNVSSLDLLHPDLYRGDDHTRAQSLELMSAYEAMGCKPTWTCAPYQLKDRPAFGEHLAWAESNAIVFANSVLGARTGRYGDFIDICCAISGRAPAAGLHLDSERIATLVFDVKLIPNRLFGLEFIYPLIGYHIGRATGSNVPVIVGMPPDVSEDQLKALGAAGASSGSLAMFHVVGVTPEAPTLQAATAGRDAQVCSVNVNDLRRARDDLTTASHADRLGVVSLGTPHYSVTEFERLMETLNRRTVHPDVRFYVSTARDVLHEVRLRGWETPLSTAGVQIIVDTCTYVTAVMDDVVGVAITDSAKWAYYAPSNLGLKVVLGSLQDCVESAVAGRITRDDTIWAHG